MKSKIPPIFQHCRRQFYAYKLVNPNKCKMEVPAYDGIPTRPPRAVSIALAKSPMRTPLEASTSRRGRMRSCGRSVCCSMLTSTAPGTDPTISLTSLPMAKSWLRSGPNICMYSFQSRFQHICRLTGLSQLRKID